MDSLNSYLEPVYSYLPVAVTKYVYYLSVLVAALLTILLLSKTADKKFIFHFKFVFFIAYFVVVCTIFWPLCLVRPFSVNNVIHYGFLFMPCSKLIGITYKIRNERNMPKNNKGCVVVANHQTMLDTMAHMYVFYKLTAPFIILVKKAVFYILPVGIPMWLSGVIFIDRTPGIETTRNQVDVVTQAIKKDNRKLWLYSEGTRNSHPEKLLPFKKGAFRIAITCQVPIVPIVISPYYFIDWKEKVFESGEVIIEILEPISTEGLTLNDVDALAEKTRKIMQEKVDNFRKEIYKSSK